MKKVLFVVLATFVILSFFIACNSEVSPVVIVDPVQVETLEITGLSYSVNATNQLVISPNSTIGGVNVYYSIGASSPQPLEANKTFSADDLKNVVSFICSTTAKSIDGDVKSNVFTAGGWNLTGNMFLAQSDSSNGYVYLNFNNDGTISSDNLKKGTLKNDGFYENENKTIAIASKDNGDRFTDITELLSASQIFFSTNTSTPQFVKSEKKVEVKQSESGGNYGYITFDSDASFTIHATKKWNGTLQYALGSNDPDFNSSWVEWNGSSVTASEAKDGKYKLFFRGTSNTNISCDSSGSGYSSWGINGTDVRCSGNIMNLLDYKDPENATMGDYCFYSLFAGQTCLVSAPYLGAKTLTYCCYKQMFYNCNIDSLSVNFTTWTDHTTFQWLYGVKSTGTFICPSELPYETGVDNIPSGWTVNKVTRVTGVTLDVTTTDTSIGSLITLTATVSPANATDKSVTWSIPDADLTYITFTDINGFTATVKTLMATNSGYGATVKVTTVDNNKDSSSTIGIYSTISFDLKGGSGSIPSQTKRANQKVDKPNTPTNNNPSLSFIGWTTDSNAFTTSTIFDLDSYVYFDTTFYAVWAPLYNVVFYKNSIKADANIYTSQLNIPGGTNATKPDDPTTITTFVFKYWSTNSNASYLDSNSEFKFTTEQIVTNTDLYAIWAPSYTVYFKEKCGSVISQTNVAWGNTVTTSTSSETTTSNYTFKFWSTNSDAVCTEEEKAFDFATQITTETNLYAIWIPPFTVNCYANGEVFASQTDIKYFTTATKPAGTPTTDTGYSFKFWSTDSDANFISPSNFEFEFDTEPIITDITLYAIWAPSYTVYFREKCGSVISQTNVAWGNTVTTSTSSETTTSNYTFKFWSTNSDAVYTEEEKAFDFATQITTETNLYAIWIPPFTVYCYKDDEEFASQTNIKYYTTATKPGTNPTTDTGFEFKYWSTDSNANFISSNYEFKFDIEPITTNTTLYAIWAPSFTVYFKEKDGTEFTSQTKIVYGSTITTNTDDPTTTSNYVFAFWSTNKNATYLETQYKFGFGSAEITTETTLYAIWIPPFTVYCNKGSDVFASQTDIKYNTLATKPEDPENTETTEFAGWTTDSNALITSTMFDFSSDKIKEDTNLYAIYVPTSGTNVVNSSTNYKVGWVKLWKGGPKWATINNGADLENYNYANINDNEITDLYSEKNVGSLVAWNTTQESRNMTGAGHRNSNEGFPETWDGSWRYPTKDEFSSLISDTNCELIWCTGEASSQYVDGCKLAGLKITGKQNGYAYNSIFLPAVGVASAENAWSMSSWTSQSNLGCYWTSNVVANDTYAYLRIENNNTYLITQYKYDADSYGDAYSVRLIYEGN